MEIQLIIQSHNFSKRLCWMLSSLCEQKSKRVNLSVHLSILKGSETVKVADFFKDRINIKTDIYSTDEVFQYRGLTRTTAIKQATADWLLFTDSDMVYHPLFWEKLVFFIMVNGLENYHGMLTAGRMSNQIIEADLLVKEKENRVSGKFIKDAFIHASSLELHRKSNVGAGYFQLINREYCDHRNYYVSKDNCKDWSWKTKFQKANSDKQFRRRIGTKKKLPLWFTENQIHLNHNRDNMTKTHITEMR